MDNTAHKLSNYELGLHRELETLYEYAQTTEELKYVITREWADRINHLIATWGEKKKFSDGGYNFFRIVSPVLQSINPAELERRLTVVAKSAKSQDRLRPYRKTRSELASTQNNQILASIFEITILSRLLEIEPATKVYPKTGNGEQDVEATIPLNGRDVYIEAKAIGYSKFDPKGPIGSQSVDSMELQVRQALSSKLEENQQLAIVAAKHPTVLCLSLGFHADSISAGWAIEDFLQEAAKDVSLILVFGSAFCNKVRLYKNPNSPHPLTDEDAEVFVALATNGRYEGE